MPPIQSPITMRRSLVALALAGILPLPALAAQVTVKEGETLSEIAERHGISLTRLMQINGIRNADQVEAGRSLTLPGGGAAGRGAGAPTAARGSGGATVTVRDGETLSEIAERHGISLSRLMQINGIRNADQVEAGQTLRLRPAGSGKGNPTTAAKLAQAPYPRNAREHVVRSGETLSEIASGYGVGLKTLISLNGISEPDHVEAGTRLKLKGTPAASPPAPSRRPNPAAAAAPRPAAPAPRPAPVAARPVAPTPQPQATTPRPVAMARPALTARPAETAQPVAASPEAPAVRPVTAAASVRPASPMVQTPLAAALAPRPARPEAMAQVAAASTPRAAAAIQAEPPARAVAVRAEAPTRAMAVAPRRATTVAAGPDWRTYGPLQVNWSAWQPMGGSMVTPTLNGQGQTQYLAINCGARKLNATSSSGQWQAWNDPGSAYEQQLVDDYCRTRG